MSMVFNFCVNNHLNNPKKFADRDFEMRNNVFYVARQTCTKLV